MSKVGVLVKCSDDKWYSHPTLGLDSNWFVCYDDDDPIELVIGAKGIGKARVVYRIVESHFRRRGCEIKQQGNMRPCGERLFKGKNEKRNKSKNAFHVWITLKNPPAELVLRHKGIHNERPKKEGVYYD